MTQEKSTVRTRIAPSPTGFPHIGTVYQALFNFSFARRHNGQFMVRIEDTDQARFVEGAEDVIFKTLDWFGLTEDESPRKSGPYDPYRQSERLSTYQEHAQELIKKGGAYYCFCTKERLDQMRKQLQVEKKPLRYDRHCRDLSAEEVSKKLDEGVPYVIRLKVPDNTQIVVKDEIRGEVTFNSAEIDEQVLLKSDGFPTYHLGVVVDDYLMKITHVVRGEEWLTSAPKHVLLYDYFGWEKPLFFHTPVLRNPDKSKLSKRHGHTNVSWYKEAGYLPEAILNYLALMGWSHPEEKEIFSLNEFISLFDLSDMKAVGPIFDLTKLTWMNGMYIREMDDTVLKKRLIDFDPKIGTVEEHIIDSFVSIAKSRIKTLAEFMPQVLPFIQKQTLELTHEEKTNRIALKAQLESRDEWNTDTILSVLRDFITKTPGINFKYLYKIVIGANQGLPLVDAFVIIGKEKTLELLG
ncbi:MAG TPA: glutamate--tRNA ligase [Candidatus Levybacteria bacterium]|nr:glutamate--tRNA ligase [Candidatus Levybacteria bacterium]